MNIIINLTGSKKKPLIFVVFLSCLMSFEGFSQSSANLAPSQYKISWQRLLLLLSATYYSAAKENQVDLDSSLIFVSRSLGLSRLPVIAEGLDDAQIMEEAKWIDQHTPATGMGLLSQAKGKKRLERLLLLGAYYSFQPDACHRYKDSVAYFLTAAINESKKTGDGAIERQALCLLGKIYAERSDLMQANAIFKMLAEECKKSKDEIMEAKALAYRGLYTAYSPATTEDRIVYLKKAIAIYRKQANTEGEINALTDIGYLQLVAFQIPNAINTFLSVLYLEESIHFPYIHYTTNILATANMIGGSFGESLRYALETKNSAEFNRDSIGWAYFYSDLGALYFTEGGREAESLQWMRKALDRFIFNKDPSLYLSLTNLVSVMILQGDTDKAFSLVPSVYEKVPPKNSAEWLYYNLALSNCYLGLGEYKKSEAYILKAAVLEKEMEVYRGPFRRAVIANQLGLIYFSEGEYDKSKVYLRNYLADPTQGGSTVYQKMIAYKKLIFIDSLLRNGVSLVSDYKAYVGILEADFSASKLRQAEELQVKYATAEKENQITLLNQKTKLEQAELKQAHLIRDLTIGAIFMILIIAGLLYRQNIIKQKNNDLISEKNEQLKHLLTEKEWLLKEIHHRVKNNFQTVMGLLGTQSGYLRNEVAISAISDSQRRIHTMSMIHQRLYQTEGMSSISMSEYIHELVDFLSDGFNTDNHIRFELDIERLELDLIHCIPLGLILNEAITNCFKYAFPDQSDGLIFISFGEVSAEYLLLTIRDNGVGVPADFDIEKSNSMGMNLMRGLSAEIGADFTICSKHGTKITVGFQYDPDISFGAKRSDN